MSTSATAVHVAEHTLRADLPTRPGDFLKEAVVAADAADVPRAPRHEVTQRLRPIK
jgi:hypothetical protein